MGLQPQSGATPVFNESSRTTPTLSVNGPFGVIHIYDAIHVIAIWTFNFFVRRTLHNDRTFPVTCPNPFLY